MYKAFKYELNLTNNQASALNQFMGCSRFVYNKFLHRKSEAYKQDQTKLSYYHLQDELTKLKKTEEFSFLKEVHSQVLQSSLRNLDNAFTNFFKGKAKFPNFKKKSNHQSIQYPQGVKLDGEKVFLPKVGWCKFYKSRDIKGVIKTVTVSKTPTNRYFVSLLCDTGEVTPNKVKIDKSSSVGIDLGIKVFCYTSDSEVFENQKHLKKSLRKLRVEQRSLARKKKGSSRRNRQRIRVAKVYERVTNQRKDYLHKLSTYFVRNYNTICIEDLNVSGMVKNHKLGRSISDMGWREFRTMLEYKCEWYGKNLLVIGRFEPSSKMCNHCGTINKELTLKDREWECSHCHSTIERDYNAALNIRDFGLGHRPSGANVVH